jgi:malonyl-CoA/methylmalonyl-CoA synthetase
VALYGDYCGNLTHCSGPNITVPEALHYSRTVAAHGMLASSPYILKAKEIQQRLAEELEFKILGTTSLLKSPLIDMRSIRFQSGRVYDQNKSALVIFTSGSTGPPKGVAVRRYNLFYSAHTIIQSQGLGVHTRTVQFLPTHHATGLLFNTIPTLVAGGCVEFDQGNFDPGSVWERIRSGDLKTFSAVPTIYVRLLRHWNAVISQRLDKEQYLKALSEISYFASSTSALSRQTFTQWLKLSGKPISERYGGSEFGNVYINPPGLAPVPVRHY